MPGPSGHGLLSPPALHQRADGAGALPCTAWHRCPEESQTYSAAFVSWLCQVRLGLQPILICCCTKQASHAASNCARW